MAIAKPKPAIDPAEIEKVIREIVTRFRPERVILFGSFAYGQPHQWSDVDLLVVTSQCPPRNERWKVSHELDKFISSPLQIIFLTPEEFGETRDVVGGIAFPAHRWGKVIYESHP